MALARWLPSATRGGPLPRRFVSTRAARSWPVASMSANRHTRPISTPVSAARVVGFSCSIRFAAPRIVSSGESARQLSSSGPSMTRRRSNSVRESVIRYHSIGRARQKNAAAPGFRSSSSSSASRPSIVGNPSDSSVASCRSTASQCFITCSSVTRSPADPDLRGTALHRRHRSTLVGFPVPDSRAGVGFRDPAKDGERTIIRSSTNSSRIDRAPLRRSSTVYSATSDYRSA